MGGGVLYVPSDPVSGGVWGLEAKHTYDAELTLNDPAAWPQYKVKKIAGLHSLPDSPDEDATKATARHGEVPLTSFFEGKTVTYEGLVRGRTEAELRSAISAMGLAFSPRSVGEMVIEPDPAYDSGSRVFYGRPRLLEIVDEIPAPHGVAHGHERPFVLGLRLYDPRIYDGAEISATSSSTTAPRQLTVTNSGNAPTDPELDIYGPVTNPQVTNLTTSRVLKLANLTIASGDFVRIDFRNRTVFLNDDPAFDFRQKLDLVNSDWWDAGVDGLATGPNTIKLTGGTGIASPCHIVVTALPAYWL